MLQQLFHEHEAPYITKQYKINAQIGCTLAVYRSNLFVQGNELLSNFSLVFVFNILFSHPNRGRNVRYDSSSSYDLILLEMIYVPVRPLRTYFA